MPNTHKPPQISVEDFIKTMTMFYIDESIEDSFSAAIEQKVTEVKDDLISIGSMDGLKKYIQSDAGSLKQIVSLLNTSEEKFRRIITMLRLEKKHMPQSEWDLKAIWKQLINNDELMVEVCELLMNGSNLEKYRSQIPKFYLESFKIDASTIGRLGSTDDIERSIKKGMSGAYSNKVGASFFGNISKSICNICDKEGLTYGIKTIVPLLGRKVGVVIPDETNPRIIIDISYNVTTSSTQSDYATLCNRDSNKLRRINAGKSDKDKVVLINILDGAGWVARQSDLTKIHRRSDYLFNLKSIKEIKKVIEFLYN